MVTFIIALWAWLLFGYVAIVLLLGKGVVALEDFPAYGTGGPGNALPHLLLCILLWPYTLLRALGDPGGGTGWPGDDGDPHF